MGQVDQRGISLNCNRPKWNCSRPKYNSLCGLRVVARANLLYCNSLVSARGRHSRPPSQPGLVVRSGMYCRGTLSTRHVHTAHVALCCIMTAHWHDRPYSRWGPICCILAESAHSRPCRAVLLPTETAVQQLPSAGSGPPGRLIMSFFKTLKSQFHFLFNLF